MNIDCVTTGTGFFKPGIPCVLVDGDERVVYLGPLGNVVKTTIPEFTLEFKDEKGRVSRRDFCQYGRDFVFASRESKQKEDDMPAVVDGAAAPPAAP